MGCCTAGAAAVDVAAGVVAAGDEAQDNNIDPINNSEIKITSLGILLFIDSPLFF